VNDRIATINRRTRETSVAVTISLDAPAPPEVSTGVRFLDHMLESFAMHARVGLVISCVGDLHVDDHHTVEDCALTLGAAINEALADRAGIARFADAYAPMDESLSRAVLDLSGRPAACVNLALTRERLGDVSTENLTHFFVSLSTTLRAAIHLDVLRGENDHHKAEAAFKAFALALRRAVARDGSDAIPSAKGVL
jgi:imidazoleglycerol phosphate dehydratase HisB